MNAARYLTRLRNMNVQKICLHRIILNAFVLIKNFFWNVNALRITATNMQKLEYHDIN